MFILDPLHCKKNEWKVSLEPPIKIISSSASLSNGFVTRLTRTTKMDIQRKLTNPKNIPAPL